MNELVLGNPTLSDFQQTADHYEVDSLTYVSGLPMNILVEALMSGDHRIYETVGATSVNRNLEIAQGYILCIPDEIYAALKQRGVECRQQIPHPDFDVAIYSYGNHNNYDIYGSHDESEVQRLPPQEVKLTPKVSEGSDDATRSI